MKTELTAPEQSRLAKLEKVISEHKIGFVMAADALSEIRDSKLYRTTHETFESYVREKWGWSKQHAYRMMEAAPVAKSNPQVTSQKQAEALAKVPEAKRVEVMEAAASDGPVTAAKIKQAAKTLTAAPEPPKAAPERTETVERPAVKVDSYSACILSFHQFVRHYEGMNAADQENQCQLLWDRFGKEFSKFNIK